MKKTEEIKLQAVKVETLKDTYSLMMSNLNKARSECDPATFVKMAIRCIKAGAKIAELYATSAAHHGRKARISRGWVVAPPSE